MRICALTVRKLKPGTFYGESSFDVPGGDVITLKTAVTANRNTMKSSQS